MPVVAILDGGHGSCTLVRLWLGGFSQTLHRRLVSIQDPELLGAANQGYCV